jgi:hypothetical protein
MLQPAVPSARPQGSSAPPLRREGAPAGSGASRPVPGVRFRPARRLREPPGPSAASRGTAPAAGHRCSAARRSAPLPGRSRSHFTHKAAPAVRLAGPRFGGRPGIGGAWAGSRQGSRGAAGSGRQPSRARHSRGIQHRRRGRACPAARSGIRPRSQGFCGRRRWTALATTRAPGGRRSGSRPRRGRRRSGARGSRPQHRRHPGRIARTEPRAIQDSRFPDAGKAASRDGGKGCQEKGTTRQPGGLPEGIWCGGRWDGKGGTGRRRLEGTACRRAAGG